MSHFDAVEIQQIDSSGVRFPPAQIVDPFAGAFKTSSGAPGAPSERARSFHTHLKRVASKCTNPLVSRTGNEVCACVCVCVRVRLRASISLVVQTETKRKTRGSQMASPTRTELVQVITIEVAKLVGVIIRGDYSNKVFLHQRRHLQIFVF